jgi:hypothetical protein
MANVSSATMPPRFSPVERRRHFPSPHFSTGFLVARQAFFTSIQAASAIIRKFSDREMNPGGTGLPPLTHAQFKSRFSKYTALKTETAPMVDAASMIGATMAVATSPITNTPPPASINA